MESCELVVNDVIILFKICWDNLCVIFIFWDFVECWEVLDEYIVVVYFSKFYGNWLYCLVWGYYDGILLLEWQNLSDDECVDWKNVVGIGFYCIVDIQIGCQQVYEKNDNYWDIIIIDGEEYQLLFNEKVVYYIIKDELSLVVVFSFGCVDIMEVICWQLVDQLKKIVLELEFCKYVVIQGIYIVLKIDEKFFDDVCVCCVMNLVIDQCVIFFLLFNGEGELFNYLFVQCWIEFYILLEDFFFVVKELFSYNLEKVKKLFVDVGYLKGFSFDVQVCFCSFYYMDVVVMLQVYYQQVGINMNVKMLEYGVFCFNMCGDNQVGGYLMNNGFGNFIQVLCKSFMIGQIWNVLCYFNEDFDKKIIVVIYELDNEKCNVSICELNDFIIEEVVLYVWLFIEMVYFVWWFWVKNYYGEICIGVVKFNVIYVCIWIDQEFKDKIFND